MNISSVNLSNYLYRTARKSNNLKRFVAKDVRPVDSLTNKNNNLFEFVSVSLT